MEKETKENGVAGGETRTVQRSGSTRMLLFLVVLFALTTVALSVVLALTVHKVNEDDDANAAHAAAHAASPTEGPHTAGPPTPTSAHEGVCLTEGCVMAAARVKSAMDETAPPCDDFYQFACGSWIKQHVIPDDKSRYGVFTKLRDDVSVILKYVLEAPNQQTDPEAVHRARNFYKACMDEAFPAAILQPPFYDNNQPAGKGQVTLVWYGPGTRYLNYGGIGFVIGHEMTHGFDDEGRLYDNYGNLRNWWLEGDARQFKDKAQCIIDQYSNFTVPGTGGLTLNGVNTQGENIADNGGIKESFTAYRKWVAARGKEEDRLPGLPYTSSQMYFINAAQFWCGHARIESKIELILTDYHSLDPYRVYGPMQNFAEFSKVFSCPVGAFMNKADRCAVW